MRPRWQAAALARAVRAASWAVKALVEATPISGPAWVGHSTSASRAMEEWWALTTAAVANPCALHQRNAASVSAVSPDWLMASASVPGTTAGSR